VKLIRQFALERFTVHAASLPKRAEPLEF
jgi:hypothetical protein